MKELDKQLLRFDGGATKLRLVKASSKSTNMKHGRRRNKERNTFEKKCIRKVPKISWTKITTTEQMHIFARTATELLNHTESR